MSFYRNKFSDECVSEGGVERRQNGRREWSVVLKLLDEEDVGKWLWGGGKTTRGPVLSGDQSFFSARN